MVKNLIKKIFLPIALALAPAQAELLLEPGLGYTHITSKGDRIHGGNKLGQIKYAYHGGIPSLKLAYHAYPALIGLDTQITIGNLKAEEQENDSNVYNSAFGFSLGALFGLYWTNNARVRATYYFASTLAAGDSVNQPTLKGKGLGFGFDLANLLPYGELGLTYKYMTYEREGEEDYDNDFKAHELALGLSFPMLF